MKGVGRHISGKGMGTLTDIEPELIRITLFYLPESE